MESAFSVYKKEHAKTARKQLKKSKRVIKKSSIESIQHSASDSNPKRTKTFPSLEPEAYNEVLHNGFSIISGKPPIPPKNNKTAQAKLRHFANAIDSELNGVLSSENGYNTEEQDSPSPCRNFVANPSISNNQKHGKKLLSGVEPSNSSESDSSPAIDSKTPTNYVSLPKTQHEVNFFDRPRLTFEWLIAPITTKNFFSMWWESTSLYINRGCADYHQELLTTKMIDSLLRTSSLYYTKNIDVVSYENGKRETHNPEGLVYPAVLWDYYKNGCSIRILNPHTYCKRLHSLIATLQEYFGCMVGVNAYLTPPGSQGFAPHYDDIEAFVLQLEGRKHWKLYAPLTKEEVLPRYSSKNFERHELENPLDELTLNAGDLLYFPRGTIHEGFTDPDSHSLHITISVYQKTSYVDLLEHTLKTALRSAALTDLEYRKGLPLQYLKHTGYVNSQTKSNIRSEIISNVKKLIVKLADHISVDEGADELGKQFMWDAMPPVLFAAEKSCMVHENSDRLVNGIVCDEVAITLDIKVRLLSYHCLRVVPESDREDTVRIYYSTENAKYYHGIDQQFLELDKNMVPALEYLIHSYPNYVEINAFPLLDDNSKMQVVSDLWEHGLLVTESPLQS